MGINPNNVSNFEVLDQEQIKNFHIYFMDKDVFRIANIFGDKRVALLKAPNGSSFLISDSPIAMYNHFPNQFNSRGVSVLGIEIQLPISNKLCLSFICPKLYESISMLNEQENQKIKNSNYFNSLILSIQTGDASEINNTNLRWINTIQIVDALRYIYSEKDDFYLAKKLVKEHPDIVL